MSNFYVGQKVVCVSNVWFRINNLTYFEKLTYMITKKYPRSKGPAHGDVCTVFDGYVGSNGCQYIRLCEWPKNEGYDASSFRPLYSLTEQMERIEKEGAPVEEPQHA
jgi:hypothetical protein